MAEHPSPASMGQGHPALSLAAPRLINRRRDVKEVNEQGILHNLFLPVLFICVLCPGRTPCLAHGNVRAGGTFLRRDSFIPRNVCAPVFFLALCWFSERSLIQGSSRARHMWWKSQPYCCMGTLVAAWPEPGPFTHRHPAASELEDTGGHCLPSTVPVQSLAPFCPACP